MLSSLTPAIVRGVDNDDGEIQVVAPWRKAALQPS